MDEEGEGGRPPNGAADATRSSPETPREAAVERKEGGTETPMDLGGSAVRDSRPGSQQVEATAGVNETKGRRPAGNSWHRDLRAQWARSVSQV